MAIEDLKRRAVELRRQGLRPNEISGLLDSGHSAWTIRRWLRGAGFPPTRSRVLDLASTRDTREIAKILNISSRRVRTIIHEAGLSEWRRKTTKQNVDLFLSDPRKYIKARFTQSWQFGWMLLKSCSEKIDKAPLAGLEILEVAMELLDRVRKTRKVEATKRQSLCLYLLSHGLEAHVYMVTNRHRMALAQLRDAFESSAGCILCEADQLRRIGVLYGTMKRWADAYSSLNGSISRYHSIGNAGHDLYGNGMVNCLYLKCELQYFTVSPEAGAMEARRALRILTGKESPALLGNLVFALAKCLQPSRNPRDVQESQELLDWCFDNLNYVSVQSVARAMVYWLRGSLAYVMGRIDNAIEDLTFALEDARALKLEQDAARILADLGALNPDPREIRNTIEDFCDWTDAGDLIVPSWLSNVDAEIRAVYELALKSRTRLDASVFLALREAAGGESRMPAFISYQTNSRVNGRAV